MSNYYFFIFMGLVVIAFMVIVTYYMNYQTPRPTDEPEEPTEDEAREAGRVEVRMVGGGGGGGSSRPDAGVLLRQYYDTTDPDQFMRAMDRLSPGDRRILEHYVEQQEPSLAQQIRERARAQQEQAPEQPEEPQDGQIGTGAQVEPGNRSVKL